MNLLRKSETERQGGELLRDQERNKTCHKIPHNAKRQELCGYEEEKGKSEKDDVDKESKNNQGDEKA
jgi:hypothetical protein